MWGRSTTPPLAPAPVPTVPSPAPVGGPPGDAPIADDTHMGWKSATCDSCHDLPVDDHTSVYAPDCAACHGGNGACDAAAVVDVAHDPTLDCTACHGLRHDYSAAEDCTSCHFATAGLTDCGAPVLGPDALVGGLLRLAAGRLSRRPTWRWCSPACRSASRQWTSP